MNTEELNQRDLTKKKEKLNELLDLFYLEVRIL